MDALEYVARMTCTDRKGGWTFEPGYDPQVVRDALKNGEVSATVVDNGRVFEHWVGKRVKLLTCFWRVQFEDGQMAMLPADCLGKRT